MNELVWDLIENFDTPIDTIDMEQAAQSLVTYMEHNGFPFAKAAAIKLADHLEKDLSELIASVSENVCGMFVPAKKHVVKPVWNDPYNINACRTYKKPRTDWGEDLSRAVWADMTFPAKSAKTSDPTKRGTRTEGAPYCSIKWRPFQPTSRDQIREALVRDFGWEPTEWTDKGNPTVNDTVLRELAEKIPYD